MGQLKVCVVGAGIIGVNTALELQRKYPTLVDITIIAEKFNEETTSNGAAGLLFTSGHFLGPNLQITKDWIKDSFNFYKNMLNDPYKKEFGVVPITGFTLSDNLEELKNDYMEYVCEEHRYARHEELEKLPQKVKYGKFFSTMVIPCKKFLPAALKQFTSNGGVIKKGVIKNLHELEKDYDVIFNCTGLGSKKLCNDSNVVPIRGQVTKVTAPWVKHFYYGSSNSYIIPSGYDNLVTIGGTTDYANASLEFDKYQELSMMSKCSEMVTGLDTAPVVKRWVGLRPYRTSVFVQAERKRDTIVVHNYGHGGYGITSGPGTSKHAVQLFEKVFSSSGSISKL